MDLAGVLSPRREKDGDQIHVAIALQLYNYSLIA